MNLISVYVETCIKLQNNFDSRFIYSIHALWLAMSVFDLISMLFVMAAKQINHHTTPDLCCFVFTSHIINHRSCCFCLSFSSDWVFFRAVCDKAFMFANAVNKNRILRAYEYRFEETGSESGDSSCHFGGRWADRTWSNDDGEEKMSILSWTVVILLGTVMSNLFCLIRQ